MSKIRYTGDYKRGKLDGYKEAWEMVKGILPEGYTLMPIKLQHHIAALECMVERIDREANGPAHERYK